jgi:hypothetical protein
MRSPPQSCGCAAPAHASCSASPPGRVDTPPKLSGERTPRTSPSDAKRIYETSRERNDDAKAPHRRIDGAPVRSDWLHGNVRPGNPASMAPTVSLTTSSRDFRYGAANNPATSPDSEPAVGQFVSAVVASMAFGPLVRRWPTSTLRGLAFSATGIRMVRTPS